MRILTYKRTHTGDPDVFGRFGIRDCMGRVRSLRYDAVIGVGGIGREPRACGIDGRVTWVGIGPRRNFGAPNRRAEIVTFQHFVLFDQAGPFLDALAPTLAKRMFGGRRYVLDSYSETEKAEAMAVVNWALGVAVNGQPTAPRNRRHAQMLRKLAGRRNICRPTTC